MELLGWQKCLITHGDSNNVRDHVATVTMCVTTWLQYNVHDHVVAVMRCVTT